MFWAGGLPHSAEDDDRKGAASANDLVHSSVEGSVKIDPRHPHLLVEWPARSRKLWRFRMGYRWDANAQAYIFPSLAFKKVDGPMAEYQKDKSKSIQTDKAKQDRRKQRDETGALRSSRRAGCPSWLRASRRPALHGIKQNHGSIW